MKIKELLDFDCLVSFRTIYRIEFNCSRSYFILSSKALNVMILEWSWHGDPHIPLISRTTFLVSFGVTLQYSHLRSTTELQWPMCIWVALIGFGRMNNVLRYTVTCSCVNSSNTPSFLNASWILEFYLSKSLKNPNHFNYSYLSHFSFWSLFYYFVYMAVFLHLFLLHPMCVLLSEARWGL